MKQLTTYLGLLLLCLLPHMVGADIGDTYLFKKQRTQLIQQIGTLKNDSMSAADLRAVNELQHKVLLLDGEILISYDETVSRLADQLSENGSTDKLAVYMAMATTVIALLLAIILYAIHKHILEHTGMSASVFYQEVAKGFASGAVPKKASSPGALRINVVVLIGLGLMFISILAYLISRLS